MRDRKTIERDGFVNNGSLLEVLLDIRDLLNKLSDAKDLSERPQP